MKEKYVSIVSMISEKTGTINQKLYSIKNEFLRRELEDNILINHEEFILILGKYSEVIFDYNTLLAQILIDITSDMNDEMFKPEIKYTLSNKQ